MAPDESNEFFGHLDQPARADQRRRPSSSNQSRPDDFASVPDPFAVDEAQQAGPDDSPRGPISLTERGRARQRAPKGPGLSPGIPNVRDPHRPQTQEIPRSGVVLTPKGVKRVDDEPPPAPPTPPPQSAVRRVSSTPESEPDFHEQSRQANDADDVSWEEYAAEGFPAMAAEDFGVKTKKTDSGRVVPVAVRSDLTEEAMKGKSVKNKGGGRKPRPVAQPAGPKSFWGKVGDSLRLTKPVLDEEDETTDETARQSRKGGFARSGSLQPKKGQKAKKTPLGVAWGVIVEVAKILMLVLLLRAYVVQVSQVTGPSMDGTLHEGDRLIVDRVTPALANNTDKWWVGWLPEFVTPEFKRGDLVVVRSPEDPGLELVKRLIALPGDAIKFEDGRLYVQPAGATEFEEVDESYLNAEDLKRADGTFRSYADGDLGGYIDEGDGLVVPADRIFVMGDNRTHSNDSRRWLEIDVHRTEPPGIDRLWLHRSSIEGRVVFRIWPMDRVWPPVK
ncbi:MAG: signal peptidase I [Planctomycetes bacterium]|nr:signal peptidase I [Planctomycetota bacterium]